MQSTMPAGHECRVPGMQSHGRQRSRSPRVPITVTIGDGNTYIKEEYFVTGQEARSLHRKNMDLTNKYYQ